MTDLLSRKMVLGLAAIAANVGLVIGLAVINPSLLMDAKELVAGVVVANTGLAGYGVVKQAEIDRLANGSHDASPPPGGAVHHNRVGTGDA